MLVLTEHDEVAEEREEGGLMFLGKELLRKSLKVLKGPSISSGNITSADYSKASALWF